MIKFSGVVKPTNAHYREHGGYTWKPGDVSIWKDYSADAIKSAYIEKDGHGGDWIRPEEINKLCEYLCIDDYSEANAETLARCLKGWDLDSFTLDDWFNEPNENRDTEAKIKAKEKQRLEAAEAERLRHIFRQPVELLGVF